MNTYYIYIKGVYCNRCYIRIRKTKAEAVKGFKNIHSVRLIKKG